MDEKKLRALVREVLVSSTGERWTEEQAKRSGHESTLHMVISDVIMKHYGEQAWHDRRMVVKDMIAAMKAYG